MSVVVLAPAGRAESVALTSALEAGLGKVQPVVDVEAAARALENDGRAILVLDVRARGAGGRSEALRLRHAAPSARIAALVGVGQAAPPDCDAVFVEPFYLEDIVRWCARASVAPVAEGILEDFGAGLSHEIGNPLTSLFLQLELLKAEIKEGPAQQPLAQIEEAARRIQTVVHDVVQSSRRPPVAPVATTTSQVLELARSQLEERDSALAGRVHIDAPERRLVADVDVLASALTDLWEYLLRAGDDHEPLAVSGSDRPQGQLVLAHHARTPRLPPDAAARLFTPLWARMALGLPAGLSLTAARSALLRHGGDLRARLLPDEQLLVEALLPTQSQAELPFSEGPT